MVTMNCLVPRLPLRRDEIDRPTSLRVKSVDRISVAVQATVASYGLQSSPLTLKKAAKPGNDAKRLAVSPLLSVPW